MWNSLGVFFFCNMMSTVLQKDIKYVGDIFMLLVIFNENVKLEKHAVLSNSEKPNSVILT